MLGTRASYMFALRGMHNGYAPVNLFKIHTLNLTKIRPLVLEKLESDQYHRYKITATVNSIIHVLGGASLTGRVFHMKW